MDFIPWSDDYLTGVAEVDADHRRLFALVNRLHARVRGAAEGAGDGVDEPAPGLTDPVATALAALADYVEYHFAREEEVMENAGYPDLIAHMNRHRNLARTVRSLVTMHAENPAQPLGDDVLAFLKDWLTGHIIESDMAYVPFVKDMP